MHRQAKHACRKTAPSPSRGAKSLPRKYFVSPDIFAKEQSEILSKRWLLVGHQSQIPKPGDYFLAAIADESVIVSRDQKSQVRGLDRKSTRLNSSHRCNSYAVFCLKKKK